MMEGAQAFLVPTLKHHHHYSLPLGAETIPQV